MLIANPPVFDEFFAVGGAMIEKAQSSHVVMLANPDLVTDVIRTAANSVQRA